MKTMNLLALLLLISGNAFAAKTKLKTSTVTDICTNFTVISHRGLSGLYPEESQAAYQAAADLGTDYLEMDVHRTKDNILIVNHDDTFARTTDIATIYPNRVNDEISTFTWDEITHLKNKGVPILRLEDVINISLTHPKHPGLYIESKSPQLYPGYEKQMIDLLDSKGAFNQVKIYFQSFDIESIKRFKMLRPNVPRTYLSESTYRTLLNTDLSQAAQFATGIGPNLAEVRPGDLNAFLTAVHQAKLVVHFWTVDDPVQMKTLIDAKADGVFTNRTDLLMGVCGRGSTITVTR